MAANFPAITDHSWARPDPRAIKAAGYLGLGRYLGYDTNGRDIGQAELDSYLLVGLKVMFICQGDKSTVAGGAVKGEQHARMANERLHALGVPEGTMIVSTVVDYDAPREHLVSTIPEYTRGFNRVSNYPHRPYGSKRTLDVLCGELGLFDCGWQTRAWSGGLVSRYACMMQEVGYVLGGTSDHNSIYRMDDVEPLIWHPDESVVVPEPVEEDEMPKTYMLTSSRRNREWLTTKDPITGMSPGMMSGLTDAEGRPLDGNGGLLDGGWESNWAGLGVWEQIEGCMTTRHLTAAGVNFLNACRYAQAVANQPVTIIDLQWQEDALFQGKTVIPRVAAKAA